MKLDKNHQPTIIGLIENTDDKLSRKGLEAGMD